MNWFQPDSSKGLADQVLDLNVTKLLDMLEQHSYLWEAAARALHSAGKPLSARPAVDAAREIRAELRRWASPLQLQHGHLPEVEDPGAALAPPRPQLVSTEIKPGDRDYLSGLKPPPSEGGGSSHG